MQRRAAAVSVAIFLVVAAGAYAFIGAAQNQRPAVDVPAEYTLQNGQSVTLGGTEYTAELSGTSGELTWVNRSDRYTTDLGNGSQVALVNDSYGYTAEPAENATLEETYVVVVPNEANVSSFSLVEYQNVSAILADDSDVENATLTRDGTEYVVYENQTLQRLSAYLPEPDRRGPYATGDGVTYEGTDTTVAAVESGGVTLEWFAPREMSTPVASGNNVTVAGTTYLAYFPANGTLELSTAHQNYQNDLERQRYFHERMNGLWGVTILSAGAAVVLVAVAFLPSRY